MVCYNLNWSCWTWDYYSSAAAAADAVVVADTVVDDCVGDDDDCDDFDAEADIVVVVGNSFADFLVTWSSVSAEIDNAAAAAES